MLLLMMGGSQHACPQFVVLLVRAYDMVLRCWCCRLPSTVYVSALACVHAFSQPSLSLICFVLLQGAVGASLQARYSKPGQTWEDVWNAGVDRAQNSFHPSYWQRQAQPQ